MKLNTVFFLIGFTFLYINTISQTPLYGIRKFKQTNELVKIDIATNALTVLDTLSIRYYSGPCSGAINYLDQKYYFVYNQGVIVVDLATGTDTLFNLHSINPYHLYHAVYNYSDGYLYVITEHIYTYAHNFCKIDVTTGQIITIASDLALEHVELGCQSAIDPLRNRYYLSGKYFTTIDLTSGQVLASVPVQNASRVYFDHMAYSCVENRFYGLANNLSLEQTVFSYLDTANGNYLPVNNIPINANFYKQYQTGGTIDNSTGIFYYSTCLGNIYGVDIQTGTIVYQHNFGVYFEHLFLQSASTFDCRTTDVSMKKSDHPIRVFPNPATCQLIIQTNDETIVSYQVDLYNLQGEKIMQKKVEQASKVFLDINGYKPGLYFLKLIYNDRYYVEKVYIY